MDLSAAASRGFGSRPSNNRNRLPLTALQAKQLGLLDDCFGNSHAEFLQGVATPAESMLSRATELLAIKQAQRSKDELLKPLAAYLIFTRK